jgi:hypothetical protein
MVSLFRLQMQQMAEPLQCLSGWAASRSPTAEAELLSLHRELERPGCSVEAVAPPVVVALAVAAVGGCQC